MRSSKSTDSARAQTKLEILGRQASFDSCGCPRIFETKWQDEFIYRAVGDGGRCVNLFKVLQTNACKNNCLYCANRRDRDFLRLSFGPGELAGLFFQYYQKRKAQGLFLSSAIDRDANFSQEKMLETLKILRQNYLYKGYVHFKIMPAADKALIYEAAKLSNRISLNLEAPTEFYLRQISPEKDFRKILISTLENMVEINKAAPLDSGMTTQLMVGLGETDREMLGFSEGLYKRYGLARIYYSGFFPVKNTPLESFPACSRRREYRLYQADFLLRRYGFKKEEMVFNQRGNLLEEVDPKLAWAQNHPEKFPVEINKAGLEQLIRIPGIGRISAEKILNFRRIKKITDLTTLKKIVPSLRRIQKFITLDGKFFPLRNS